LSVLRIDRHYVPGNIPGTHFVWRPNRPQGYNTAESIMSMKNSSVVIGDQTRVIPTSCHLT
jgi:hypothetical protein